jgi:hypothetical protein
MRVNIVLVAPLWVAGFALGQFVSPLPNAPFSGEMVSTQVQTLADGTHITSPAQTTKMYRDSLGRARTETYMAMPNSPQQTQPDLMNIMIMDPVEGVQYMLNPRMKTARKIMMPKRPQPSARTQAVPPGLAPQILVAPRPFGAMIVEAGGGTAALRTSSTGNALATAAPQSKNESLGTETIEGLVADGHRMTTTWPVGSMGNDREVISTNESWQSKELGMAVLSKNSDPRSGERTTKLTNVSRTEPDPALFQVPSDYTIEEQEVRPPTPVPAK